jgi:hypothetical protein
VSRYEARAVSLSGGINERLRAKEPRKRNPALKALLSLARCGELSSALALNEQVRDIIDPQSTSPHVLVVKPMRSARKH